MIKVMIDEDTLLKMLMDRLRVWNPSDIELELYENMFESEIESGIFENVELDIYSLVDNDYINYCTIISEGDKDYDKIKEIYDKEGCCDISCETSYGYLEATNEDCDVFLVRHK